VAELHGLVQQVSAKLVVIDPIVAAVESKLDAYKDQHVRQVLAQLWRVAREEDCAVALVGHLNRVPSTDAYLRIANSSAFWNAARSVVLITQDGEEDDGSRLIAQRKANLARLAPIQRHVLEEIVLPDTIDPDTGERIVTSRMRFLEIADDVNPSDVLGTRATLTKEETAAALLEALLGDGEWHESGEVKEVLAAAGFNDRMAQRAAKDLDVEHRREKGFQAKTWWRWTLATATVATTPSPRFVASGDLAQPRGTDATTSPLATSVGNKDASGDEKHVASGEIDAKTCLTCERMFLPNADGAGATACASCVGRWAS
jgi:hypothetical protein